jgi:hypothetical protein
MVNGYIANHFRSTIEIADVTVDLGMVPERNRGGIDKNDFRIIHFRKFIDFLHPVRPWDGGFFGCLWDMDFVRVVGFGWFVVIVSTTRGNPLR